MNTAALIVGIWVWVLIIGLAGVGFQLLLAFSVYNDAKARGNTEPLMWALLVGLLGWIPGIVYLCMRDSAKNRMIVCPNCGEVHPIGIPNCPKCGIYNTYCYPFYNPETPVVAKKAKKLFVAAMILLGVIVLLTILFVVLMVAGAVGYSSSIIY